MKLVSILHWSDCSKNIESVIKSGNIPNIQLIPQDFQQIIKDCLSKDPKNRPTASEIIKKIEELLSEEKYDLMQFQEFKNKRAEWNTF